MVLKTANNGAKMLISKLQSLMDRVINTQKREEIYNTILSFAKDSPLYFIFLTLQLLLAGLPILLFLSFASSVLLLSLSTAILFSLFWIGVAVCLLIPTLCITICLATVFFCWTVCVFWVGKWVYGFVPVNSKSTLVVQSKGKGKIAVAEKKGEGFEDLMVDTNPTEGNDEFTNGHIDEASTS